MTPPEDLAERTDALLRPDPRRAAARVFLPGHELSVPGASRAGRVVDRCLALTEDQAGNALASVRREFGDRHRDLDAVLENSFDAIAHRVPADAGLTAGRRLLLGACFTREIAVEGAALCNPSVVAQPLPEAASGSVRFVLSARAISEGHLSALVFRGGTFTPGAGAGAVTLDAPSRWVDTGTVHRIPVPRERLRHLAAESGADGETLAFVLSCLPAAVAAADLDAADEALTSQALTRTDLAQTVHALRAALAASYEIRFPDVATLGERTMLPVSADESHGIEDARFVRCDDGDATFAATYTGYDGTRIVGRRLDTDDFRSFASSPLTGRAARGKGMALFPRRVGGRFVALSRWDGESNALASSADGYHWDDVEELQQPSGPWDLVQLGNCGSPLETEAGWLVLTHGVGPMRTYTIGAVLLDRDDPRRVVGRLDRPLLRPGSEERDGYVPNVVYSCGGLLHGRSLLLPYGCSDQSIRFAVVALPALLAELTGR